MKTSTQKKVALYSSTKTLEFHAMILICENWGLPYFSVKFTSVGRRKISLTQLLSSDNPELQRQTSQTNFYMNLHNVPSQVIVNIPTFSKLHQHFAQNPFFRANSVLSDISETDAVSDFSVQPSLSASSSTPGSAPVRPRRRSGAAPSLPGARTECY